MHARAIAATVLALLLAGFPAGSSAREQGEQAPDATRVIVRGKTKLADALESALLPAWSDRASPRPVVIVIDVSPNVEQRAELICDAVKELEARGRAIAGWRVAPLGKKLGPAVSSAEEFAVKVGHAVASETPAPSTIEALRKTLKSVKGKDTVVAYLADWRFEDDCDLEKFIKELQRKRIVLSVVGSEAAFGRGWNDGIRDGGEIDINDVRGGSLWYFEEIGRDPFGRGSHETPWHGGETAYPHMPYRWAWLHWESAFSWYDWDRANLDGEDETTSLPEGFDPDDPESLEELRKRLKDRGDDPLPEAGDPDDEGLSNREKNVEFPLPSAFGPYALMRAAGVTGGRYVLFSWNPKGRRKVKYDYARCNLFPPDLRARKQILASVRENVYARAVLQAWHVLLDAGPDVVEMSPPVDARLRAAARIDSLIERHGQDLRYLWDNRSEHKQFVKAAPRAMAVIDRALVPLDAALEGGEVPDEDLLRRHEADARYFRHALRVTRFEINEHLQAASDLPKDAWKRDGERPGVGHREWIQRGRNPDRVRTDDKMPPFDPEAGARLLAERKELLRKFQGTPWGEQLALNTVDTSRSTWWTEGTPPKTGRSPTESTAKPPPKAPGGGSGSGGAPSTGGG